MSDILNLIAEARKTAFEQRFEDAARHATNALQRLPSCLAALRILARRKPTRTLKTNVEFYTALLLEALSFPREAFTAVFAMGRIGGWIAHAREQALSGRLIRPQSLYIGPRPERAA